MGACATKILTKDEGTPAPEAKPEEHEREVAVVAENKVITADVVDDDSTKPKSLAEMLEDEGKAPVTEEATKPVEEKPIESTTKEETSKSIGEPAKTEPVKIEETKPVEPPKKPEEPIEKIQVEEKKPVPTK